MLKRNLGGFVTTLMLIEARRRGRVNKSIFTKIYDILYLIISRFT